MDIATYLLETLLDCYEKYCSFVKEMSQDEIDSMFLDDNGMEISDREFFYYNNDNILNDEVIDSAYGFIVDMAEQGENDINKIVSFLSGKYFLFRYGEDSVVKYLGSAELEEIVRLFKENVPFGISLLKNYFESILDKEKCDEKKKAILENGDMETFNKFENNGLYQVIESLKCLNDLLRGILVRLYDHSISNGCDDETALSNVWSYFFSDFDPLHELDDMGMDEYSKKWYKKYMLNLIMADLYEDVCNEPIIQSINPKDCAAFTAPILSMRMKSVALPADAEIRNRLMKAFIILQHDKEKRKQNRIKTIKDERILELKHFNPLYMLDEIEFNKKI